MSFDFAQDHELVEWPRKSGHTRNAGLTIIQHGGRCPDLSGPAGALLI